MVLIRILPYGEQAPVDGSELFFGGSGPDDEWGLIPDVPVTLADDPAAAARLLRAIFRQQYDDEIARLRETAGAPPTPRDTPSEPAPTRVDDTQLRAALEQLRGMPEPLTDAAGEN